MNRLAKLLIIEIPSSSAVAFGILWAAVQAAEHYKVVPESLSKAEGVTFLLLVSLAVNLGCIYGITTFAIRFGRRRRETHAPKEGHTTGLVSAVLEALASASSNEEYVDVLRIGGALSRAFWLYGEYEARIQIGQLVEDAAVKLDRPLEQAKALIDDIGWTLVVQGRFDEATGNITHGKKIAERIKNHYLKVKAKRHLAGIHIYKGEPKEAEVKLRSALKEADLIEDPEDRKEMLAGVLYGLAEIAIRLERYTDALSWSQKSAAIYDKIGDEGRRAKLYSQQGRIYEAMNLLAQAKDVYRRGLEESKRLKRKDEILANCLPLGRVHMKLGEAGKGLACLRDARALAKEMGSLEQEREAAGLIRKAKEGRHG